MGGKLGKLLKELDVSKSVPPEAVQMIFAEFDKQNKGYLTRVEVRLLITEWCNVHHRQDIDLTTDSFMRRFDVDGDGKITKHELVSGGVGALPKSSREWSDVLRTQVMAALHANDKDVAKLLLDGVTSVNLTHFVPVADRQALGDLKTGSNVNLDTKMVQTLRDAMVGNASVKSFSVVITDELNVDGVNCLSNLIQINQHISTLKLSFRDPKANSSRGWAAFGKIFEKNTVLRDISMCDDLNFDVVDALAQSLSKVSSVHSLAFSNCGKLGLAGLEVIIKMLPFVNLTHLAFDQVEIGESGAAVLGQVLSTNNTITQLTCKTCGIGSGGAGCFAQIIETNTCLETLDLIGNLLGEQGVVSIAGALSRNRKLARLKLGWGLHFMSVGRGLTELRGAIEMQILLRNGLLGKEESKTNEFHSQAQTTLITFADLLNVDKIVSIGGSRVYPSRHALLLDCLRTTPDFSVIQTLLDKRILTSQILVHRRMSAQDGDTRKKSLLSRIIDALNRNSSNGKLNSDLEASVFHTILERFPEIFDTPMEDHSGTSYSSSCGPALRQILDARIRINRAETALVVAEQAAAAALTAYQSSQLWSACARGFAASVGAAMASDQADEAVAQSGWSVSSIGQAAFFARAEADKQKMDRKAFGATSLLFY